MVVTVTIKTNPKLSCASRGLTTSNFHLMRNLTVQIDQMGQCLFQCKGKKN